MNELHNLVEMELPSTTSISSSDQFTLSNESSSMIITALATLLPCFYIKWIDQVQGVYVDVALQFDQIILSKAIHGFLHYYQAIL